ncbi:MAG: hypothetical protein ACRCXH_01405 [Shewanella sp.]
MSSVNERHGPSWQNVFAALSFVGMTVTAWVNLRSDVAGLQANDRNKAEAIEQIRTETKENGNKLDQLLMASGIKTERVSE